MNINFRTFSDTVATFFSNKLQLQLTPLQKRISLIAIIAIGFIASCYLVKRCFFNAEAAQEETDLLKTPEKSPLLLKTPEKSPVIEKLPDVEKEEVLSPEPEREEVVSDAFKETLDEIFGKQIEETKPSPVIVQEDQYGVFNGVGKRSFAKGMVGEGQMTCGALNGIGKMTASNGDLEIGDFKHNFLEGFGKKIMSNGTVEKGIYLKGDLKTGTITSQGKTKIGNFKDNLLEGFGIELEGDKGAQGIFQAGRLIKSEPSQSDVLGTTNGYGIRRYVNGDTDQGFFIDGRLMGPQGRITNKDTGMIEEGEILNNTLHGHGKRVTVDFLDTLTEEGEFLAGKRHGKAKMEWSNGDFSEGEFEEGFLNGRGTVITKGVSEMDGIFVRGELVKGIKKLSNGNTHEGEFEKGELEGIGKLYWGDKLIFDGTFVKGELVKGISYRINEVKEGKFEHGYLTGKGKITTTDGDVEEGDFKYNYLNGTGTITYKNGKIEEGEFIDGKLYGHGKVIENGIIVKEGIFIDGEWIERRSDSHGIVDGQGKRQYDNGEVAEGFFKNGLLHGKQGKLLYPDAGGEEGEFKEGILNGSGKKILKDGKTIEGVFAKGILHGYGKELLPDGSYLKGDFKDGVLHGRGNLYNAQYNEKQEGDFENGVLVKGTKIFSDGKKEEVDLVLESDSET